MRPLPNTIAIFGNAPNAADVALRKVLKFKDTNGPVIIMDYIGRGAVILSEENKMGLLRRPVAWYDLSDRRSSVTLFHLRRSEQFRPIILRILQSIREISCTPLPDTALTWTADAAFALSKNGTISLGTLLRYLSTPEVRRWFHDTHGEVKHLGQLVAMIAWALRYPSVYAISEGVNRPNIEEKIRKPSVIWLEFPIEHFEKREHLLSTILAEAAVEESVRTVAASVGKVPPSQMSTIVHLFPLAAATPAIPQWIKDTSHQVRHISVHHLYPDRPLHQMQTAWAIEAANLWIVGKVQILDRMKHEKWLHPAEIERINSLEQGDLWFKANETGKAIVAKVGYTKEMINPVHRLRQATLKHMRTNTVQQMSTAAVSVLDDSAGYDDIYSKLCDREMLRLGWFKVQKGKKDAHGIDHVTIAMFKKNLESELSCLAHELKSRTYRCRPLERFFIAKEDGSQRPLTKMCTRDRVVQATCILLLEPIFEPLFSPYSFAFRPRRGAHQAIARVRGLIAAGRTWAIIADIHKCFDSLDHEVLLRLLEKQIKDQDILNLIGHWLSTDILDFREIVPLITGVPQGESLSPLLANIYLDTLDKHLENVRLDFVRYADDITILVKSKDDAEKALQILHDFLLDPLHLELKVTKTNYVSCDEGFDYLGFRIDSNGLEIKKGRIDDIQRILRGYIQNLGALSATLEQRAHALTLINATTRGFRNYFAIPDEHSIEQQLRYLDGCLEQIGNFYLPPGIKDDPAWLCRERFCLPTPPESSEDEKGLAEREARTGGYPDCDTEAVGSQWMIKGGKTEDKENKSTVIIEDPVNDDDPSEGNLRNTIIDDGKRLYVLTNGSYVTVSDNELVVKKRKNEIYRRSLDNLDLLFLQGFGMNISINLHLRLAESGIPAVIAPPIGAPIAVLNPVNTAKSYLRSRQVLRRDDPDVIATGLDILAAKVGNQAALFRYFAKYRNKANPESGKQLSEAAEKMCGLSDSIRMIDPVSASVRPMAMGFEGHAAAVYWRQLIGILPAKLGFSGRVTKTGKDKVNQCLNYVYGILYGEVWRAVVKAGLDPYFGVMHGSMRDQGSLVFDLIEEFRAPFADRTVIGILGRGFQPEFNEQGFLKTKTRRQLAISFSKRWLKNMDWRSHSLSPAGILEKQADSLAKLFQREGRYHAYKMRW